MLVPTSTKRKLDFELIFDAMFGDPTHFLPHMKDVQQIAGVARQVINSHAVLEGHW